MDIAISKNPDNHDYTDNFKKLLQDATKESMPLLNGFNIPHPIVTQMPYLIIANMIHAHKTIEIEQSDELIKEDFFELRETPTIKINYKISKNELIEWIHANWNEDLGFIQRLPSKPDFRISKRDRKIVELRDKKRFRFAKIANEIIKEYGIDDAEANINENSVKMAYKRAKDIIKSLKR